MFSQIKLYLGGAVLAVGAVLLAMLKIKSKKLDDAKQQIKQQKLQTEIAQEAAVAIEESNKVTEEALKVHEKVSSTSSSDDRDWLRKRHYNKDGSGEGDKL